MKDRVKSVMNYKKPAFWIVVLALAACAAAAVCFLTVPAANSPDGPWIMAEDGSGMPAPQGGPDPYADLEPAERAAAFLENADMMSFEFTPILMYGAYIVPAMEYKPWTGPTAGFVFDLTELILGYLHGVDLSALEPLSLPEIQAFEAQLSESGLIHVGDARCRIAVWFDQATLDSDQEVNGALVFTFSDGTMCGFGGDAFDRNIMSIEGAIDMAGEARNHALTDQSGSMTVTRLSTGESRTSSMFGSALIACVFDSTVLLGQPEENAEGSFDVQVSFEGGAVYLFDYSALLIQTEDGQVYSIGGFGEGDGEVLKPEMIPMVVLNGLDVPDFQPQV